jgi:regulator of cell morphogenesis and NO signaling
MHEGHQHIFEQLQFFRTLTNDYKITEDMCEMHKRLYTDMKKFEQELSRHIYLEREILMPAVIQMDKNSSKRNTKNFNAQNAL